MSSFYGLLAKTFEFFARRRILLYALIVAVVASSSLVLRSIKLSEDIQPLIPSGSSDAALDFRFLQQAPFIQKVVFNIRAETGTDRKGLIEAADKLAGALKSPYYSRVVSGPGVTDPEILISWVLRATPSLMTGADMQKMEGLLTPKAVNDRLADIKRKLDSPEGWIMKSLFREDPLQLYLITLERLKFLNAFKGMTLESNHFVSADGRNALLLAETPIKITDSSGSKELVNYTQGIIEAHRTPDVAISFLSGHAYTTANAETIKEDLYTILTCASATILILLFLFLRNWRAIYVFLVPTSVVCIATAGVLLAYDTISAVTIAFGSVLMGIADDYPIFTYFSLRNSDYSGETVARISRPILFSGITTMATFSALFFSDLPGQRQIALFSIIGITASLAFSLIILPHFLRGLRSAREVATGAPASDKGRAYRGFVIVTWVLVMALCLWQGSRVRFNGDMRCISMIPKAISNLEEELKRTWGDFRGMAMVFTEGSSLEKALQNNDRLFAYLKGKIPDEGLVSLAPVLPSEATQEANRKRWETFWSDKNRSTVRSFFVAEGEKAGFTGSAFEPFFDRLTAKPVPVTVEGLRKAGLGDAIDAMVVQDGPLTRVLTLVPDTPEAAALFSKKTDTPFVARFVSTDRFNKTISRAMVRNFATYIITASAVILLFLIILFRNVRTVLYAAIPVATGLIFMFGAMGWRGVEFNLFNIIATILVIGLSVDLGIFMVSRVTGGNDRNTSLAVLLGGLTSLVGMGALTLARHPALSSIGVSVLLGMCGAIPSALFVIPAFYRRGLKGSKDRGEKEME
jgi:predicted exporter